MISAADFIEVKFRFLARVTHRDQRRVPVGFAEIPQIAELRGIAGAGTAVPDRYVFLRLTRRPVDARKRMGIVLMSISPFIW